jgi:hypothetical protein
MNQDYIFVLITLVLIIAAYRLGARWAQARLDEDVQESLARLLKEAIVNEKMNEKTPPVPPTNQPKRKPDNVHQLPQATRI